MGASPEQNRRWKGEEGWSERRWKGEPTQRPCTSRELCRELAHALRQQEMVGAGRVVAGDSREGAIEGPTSTHHVSISQAMKCAPRAIERHVLAPLHASLRCAHQGGVLRRNTRASYALCTFAFNYEQLQRHGRHPANASLQEVPPRLHLLRWAAVDCPRTVEPVF